MGGTKCSKKLQRSATCRMCRKKKIRCTHTIVVEAPTAASIEYEQNHSMVNEQGVPVPKPQSLQNDRGSPSAGGRKQDSRFWFYASVSPEKPKTTSSSTPQEDNTNIATTMASTGNAASSKGMNARAESPDHPPYSPITPTMSSAHLPTPTPTATATNPFTKEPQTKYTHTTQAKQTSIPPPKPVPVDFDSNSDVIAVKSTMSILLLQRKKALDDIARLKRMKEEARKDPKGFAQDLFAGKIKTDPSDTIFNPLGSLNALHGSGIAKAKAQAPVEATDDDEDEATETDGDKNKAGKVSKGKGKVDKAGEKAKASLSSGSEEGKWGSFPAPQNVVKVPPINWEKYAVVGESLEKLHLDQVQNPPGTMFQFGAGGGGAAPAPAAAGGEAKKKPAKAEKMSTRKGGKR